MKGTGVQTDPFLIETWDDFFDMTDDSSSTYYMLANDLDGNDYNGGVFGYNNIVHTNLDGNGHTIRNLYYMHSTVAVTYYLMRPKTYNGTWKNLTIENVQTNINVFGYIQTQRAFSMENCIISAECYAFAYSISVLCTECTVSLKATAAIQTANSNSSYRCSFTRCSVHCRLSVPTQYWNTFYLNTSRLELELDTLPSGTFNTAYYASAINSVIAICMPDVSADAYIFDGDNASPSVMDATLWGDNPTSGITDIILLPTESMKNADALNAAGFTVVRVS